jgi:hypothetical protein
VPTCAATVVDAGDGHRPGQPREAGCDGRREGDDPSGGRDRELKTDLPGQRRIGDKQNQHGAREGRERGRGTTEKDGEEGEQGHDPRAKYGRPGPREDDEGNDGSPAQSDPSEEGKPKEQAKAEDRSKDHGHVLAGNHQEVLKAGGLEMGHVARVEHRTISEGEAHEEARVSP